MADRSECRVTATGGDAIRLIAEVEAALQPTDADRLWAGNVIRAGILDRTARGVDYKGDPFTPYSEKGPFYWYPASRSASGAKRMRRRLGEGSLTRSGTGLRFESYAAFKRALGRAGVDLRGPSAPHMLQAIVVKVQGGQAFVGIYDDFAAAKASGHNDGIHPTLPRRQFFEASQDDIDTITRDLEDRLIERARKVLR